MNLPSRVPAAASSSPLKFFPLWVILVGTIPAASALAETTWKGATGSFSDIANWTNGLPGTGNDGIIDNVGTAQIANPYASRVQLLKLGSNQQTTGTLQVTGSGWAEFQSIAVGGRVGTGTLNISGGGQVVTEYMSVAADFGSTGTVNLSGANSSLTVASNIHLGNTGSGTLNLENGASLVVPGTTRQGIIYMGSEYVATGNLNIGNGTAVGAFSVGAIMNGTDDNAGGVEPYAGVGKAVLTFSQTNNLTVGATLFGAKSYQYPDGIFNVIQSGTGTTRLTAQNSQMAGHFTITNGTLLVNGHIDGAFTDIPVPDDGVVLSQKYTHDMSVQLNGTLGGTGLIEGVTTVGGAPATTTTTNGVTTTTPSTLGGTLAPGDGIGLLSFGSDLTFNSAATLSLELGGKVRGTSYDALNVAGNLIYGGTMKLTLTNGFQPNLGDVFDFFNGYSSFVGTFSSIIFDKPGYNGTFNYQTGILTMTAVPEPSAAGLAALGLGALGWQRRRSGGQR